MKEEILKQLFSMQDVGYKTFLSALVPNIDSKTIIGVRSPILRALAKEIVKKEETFAYLKSLPHKYLEENTLHAYIINAQTDFNKTIELVNDFLPYVDNWATCDALRPVTFAKNKQELLISVKKWLNSSQTYTIRFAIEMLMTHFLDNDFKPEYLQWVSQIKSTEYYVNMMIAWYFATALAKQWQSTISYIENKKLDKWVHNKTIRKAIESYRVAQKQKEYLRTLVIKN